MDQGRGFSSEAALSHPQQCRNCRDPGAKSIVGGIQGPPAGTFEGGPQTERDGTRKHPAPVGSAQIKICQESERFADALKKVKPLTARGFNNRRALTS